MDSAQTIQLLDTAKANLTEARKDARGPRNDNALLKTILALGEIEQAARGIAERVDAIESALGNERNL